MKQVIHETVTVLLGAEEARLFTLFQKHNKDILKLLKSGVFEIKNGSFTCHLDGNSNIRKIDKLVPVFTE